MRANVLMACIAAMLVLLIPMKGAAQQIGFQVGIAQPAIPFVTPQPPAIAIGGNFSSVPTIIVPGPIVPTPLVPNPPRVLIPTQVVIPPPLIPAPVVVVPPSPRVVPGAAPGAAQLFPIGTARSEVLRLMGPPTTMIVSSDGETLYFIGGLTVIIQNGLVAGTR